MLLTTTAWKPDAGGVATASRSSDVVQRTSQIGQIGAALWHRGRADAEQGHIGSVQSRDRIRGRTEVALLRLQWLSAHRCPARPPGCARTRMWSTFTASTSTPHTSWPS